MTFTASQAFAPCHWIEDHDALEARSIACMVAAPRPSDGHITSAQAATCAVYFAVAAYMHLSEPFPNGVVVNKRFRSHIASASIAGGHRTRRGIQCG